MQGGVGANPGVLDPPLPGWGLTAGSGVPPFPAELSLPLHTGLTRHHSSLESSTTVIFSPGLEGKEGLPEGGQDPQPRETPRKTSFPAESAPRAPYLARDTRSPWAQGQAGPARSSSALGNPQNRIEPNPKSLEKEPRTRLGTHGKSRSSFSRALKR